MDRYWEGQHGAVFDADDNDNLPALREWADWSTDDMIRYAITGRHPGE